MLIKILIMGLIMGKVYNPFLDILPNIDVHGYNRDMMFYTLDVFIKDNIKLNNKKIVVIHGKGEGILKEEIHRLLSKDKRINKYYLDVFNNGCTIIELK